MGRGEGKPRNDEPASRTARIRMSWETTENGGEQRRRRGGIYKGWRRWGRGVRNGNSKEYIVRSL